MRALFCGMGSIGQRHLRDLSAVCAERGIELTADALRTTERALPEETEKLLRRSIRKMDEIIGRYDMVFVTNPTSEHETTIRNFAELADAMFIEKPVFDRADVDCGALGLKPEGFYYVACPMRYNPVINRMKEIARDNRVIAARAICSSYLPEWRSGADYRDCYSARREQGGGVVLDLIHEWDYMTDLFGMPLEARGFAGHLSPLEITSDDVAVWIARFRETVLTLHLDYIGRRPRRELELFCAEDTVVGDMLGMSVTCLKSGVAERFDICDVHLAEMRYFVDAAVSGAESANTVEQAAAVLKVALDSAKEISG